MTTVLIVEDDEINCRYMAAVVRNEGYGFVTATTGALAVEAIEYGSIDAILLDIGLPDTDGIELCKLLRARTDAAIIFVSGRKDEMDKVLALDAGGDDFVTKPFSYGELGARIRANLRRLRPSALDDDQNPSEGTVQQPSSETEMVPLAEAAAMESGTSEWELEQEQIAARHREALDQIALAYDRGESEGIAIQLRPGACAICADAARDVYLPKMTPPLPLIGCTSPEGCRCTYIVPPIDPRRRPPPIPAAVFPNLNIPRRWQDAAYFGLDQKGGCRPKDLAGYLDSYPLLPFPVDVGLHEGEVAYLARRAHRAWERGAIATGTALPGSNFPLEGALLPWVKGMAKAGSLAYDAVSNREEGLIYLTNWRILFQRQGALDSTLLVDIANVEYLRDGIACNVGSRGNRLIFLLPDSLQIGLYLAAAIRDVRAYLTGGSDLLASEPVHVAYTDYSLAKVGQEQTLEESEWVTSKF